MDRSASITAKRRETTGKGAARTSRRTGRVPGVLYGHGEESVPVSVDARELSKLIQSISVENTIVDLDLGEKETFKVLIRELQRHPFRDETLHVDFFHVAMDEKQIGRDIAEWTAKQIGGEGKVALLMGPSGAPTFRNLGDGYAEAMAKHPKIQIVVKHDGPLTRERGVKQAEDALVAHPDLKAIYTAPTREEGERRLEEFAAKWDARYPTISKQWRERWERLAVFSGKVAP